MAQSRHRHADQLLKANQLRSTPARRAVLQILAERDHALPATELADFADADRITLYRTLKTLESHGLIHRVQDISGVDKYALCGSKCTPDSHHHSHAHFYCMSCEQTTCLPEVKLLQPSLPPNYKLQEMAVTLSGTCNTCS
jgi:Fur family ferric uptake transcriptional regulator